jgi:hypothetical protein
MSQESAQLTSSQNRINAGRGLRGKGERGQRGVARKIIKKKSVRLSCGAADTQVHAEQIMSSLY